MGGGLGDLVCVRILFSQTFRICFPYYTKPLYGRYFLARFFFFSLEISLQNIFSEITHTWPRPFSKIKWSAPLNHPLNCHHLRFRDIHSFSFSCFAVLTDQNSEKPQFPSESLSSWQRALFVKYGLWSSGVHWCFQGLFQPGGPAGFNVFFQALFNSAKCSNNYRHSFGFKAPRPWDFHL